MTRISGCYKESESSTGSFIRITYKHCLRVEKMNVEQAIRTAEQFLPGVPAPDGQEDPRWKAIIAVGEHIKSDPEPIWQFIVRWASHPNADLRMAISTCLLEHLLQHHFDIIFPRVEALALQDPLFADTFMLCSKFDRSEEPENSKRVEELAEACRKRHASNWIQ